MDLLSLLESLPRAVRERLPERALDGAEELRLRAGQPVEVRAGGRGTLIGEALDAETLGACVASLTGHSFYAVEDDVRHAFFTARGGHRVGVCGRFAVEAGRVVSLNEATSLCVRVAREIRGAAEPIRLHLTDGGRVRSVLIVSAPGLGKTTMLRDAIRGLTEGGATVAVSDERGELSCGRGSALLGPRADVMEGCPKRLAIPLLVRSMSPEAVATDELGESDDARAVLDAARCGVAVLATAHARDYERARDRGAVGRLIVRGAFERVVVLGGEPGRVADVRGEKGERLI